MKILPRHDGRAAIRAWVDGVPVEDQAWRQVENVARLPFIHRHVAVMPDVHWGKGATVGSVIPTVGAIVPAAVGVDVGCGMIAAPLDLRATDLPDSLRAVRSAIEAAVPHGRTHHGGRGDRGAWSGAPPPEVEAAWRELRAGHERLTAQHRPLARANAVHHLGTLGTGNHFIELCLDERDRVWVMLHSGSRGIGNRIGTFFIERARAHMAAQGVDLPDRDLAYLPERHRDFDDYVTAVGWAQRFARASRDVMLRRTVHAVGTALGRPLRWVETVVDCHHNYVQEERHFGQTVWLTRKGAVSARAGELGIIPGSMGARSFIVRGKGNPQSFHSCAHGAGRRMSRTAARKHFTLADHAQATASVECRKDADVLDETPGAYKDIDAVMAAQRDLVDVVHTLRQIVCVKG